MLSERIVLLALLLLVAIANSPVRADTATPLKLQKNDFPTLAVNRYFQRLVIFDSELEDFPTRCDQLHLARRYDLAPRWRPAVDKLLLRYCDTRPFDELFGTDYLSYGALATFKAGAATLYGLPVVRYEEDIGALRSSQRYVLDAPIARLLKAMRPSIERDCQPMLELNPMAVTTCTMEYNGEYWYLIVGELNHTVSLGTDPDDPSRSYYQVSGGD